MAEDRSSEDSNLSLDALAAILRAVGQHPIPVDGMEPQQVTELCEGWARHVLVLAPEPGRQDTTKRRNWNGLRRFATDLRKNEHDTVAKSLAGLKDAIWDFINRLNSVIINDNDSDLRVRDQLDVLRKAADTQSPDELRRAALGVASAIGGVLLERKKAQDSQLAELGNRVRQLASELDSARREGALDALTKVYNRGAFDDYVKRVVALDGLFGKPACLLMIDVDHFKKFNDEYGHPTGDEVLRKLGDALVRSFPRSSDFVARYGGEEFAIVLRDTRLGDARMLAVRLLQSVRKVRLARAGKELGFTVSIGLAELKQGESGGSWVERADRKLYEAKHGGRDRVECDAIPAAGAATTPAPGRTSARPPNT